MTSTARRPANSGARFLAAGATPRPPIPPIDPDAQGSCRCPASASVGATGVLDTPHPGEEEEEADCKPEFEAKVLLGNLRLWRLGITGWRPLWIHHHPPPTVSLHWRQKRRAALDAPRETPRRGCTDWAVFVCEKSRRGSQQGPKEERPTFGRGRRGGNGARGPSSPEPTIGDIVNCT
jgi:hypothetical protein